MNLVSRLFMISEILLTLSSEALGEKFYFACNFGVIYGVD